MPKILSIEFEKNESCHNSGHLYVSNNGAYERVFLFGVRRVTLVLDYRPEFLEIGQNQSDGPWDTDVEVHFKDWVWLKRIHFSNAMTIKPLEREHPNWNGCLQ